MKEGRKKKPEEKYRIKKNKTNRKKKEGISGLLKQTGEKNRGKTRKREKKKIKEKQEKKTFYLNNIWSPPPFPC